MADLIDRQAAIDAFDLPIYNITGRENAERVIEYLKAVIQRIKDLPSAQPELTDEEKRLIKKLRSYHNGSYAKVIDKLLAVASAQPEVIRCGECKHRFTDGENVVYNVCELNHNKVQADDWYCADAERRTDE